MKLSIDDSIQGVPYYPKAALYGADAGWTRLASNENAYAPSPRVIEAMVNALFEVNRYPESELDLKGALALRYGLRSQNFLIGNGSNEMIETALRALKFKGRTGVIVAEPTFAFYRIAAKIYGYDVTSVPLDSFRLDLGRVTERIDERTRVIFLCNPNNPTGTIFSDRAFAAFLKSLPPEILVVVDEAYAEFAEDRLFPRSFTYVDEHPVLVLRTFSKAYGLAGLRIGYAAAEESLVSFIERTKQPFSVNMMALIAAKAALSDERHLGSVLENNRKGRKYFYDAFEALGIEFLPSQANFVLIKVGPDAEALTGRLFEKKILIRWLGAYNLPECVRVTIGTMVENKVFLEALKRLRA
jgi:histidinol-phosphate aminotransferase